MTANEAPYAGVFHLGATDDFLERFAEERILVGVMPWLTFPELWICEHCPSRFTTYAAAAEHHQAHSHCLEYRVTGRDYLSDDD